MLKKLFVIQLILLIIIATLHSIAERYSIYWTHTWTDIPMHFLGGVWVALVAVIVYLFIKERYGVNIIYSHTLFVFVFVAVVGLAWELLEVFIWNNAGACLPSNYIPDTLLDLLMDFLGATFVVSLARGILNH